MAKSEDILVARETFSAQIDGEVYIVHKGKTRVRVGHPLLNGNEDRFEPVDLGVHFDVDPPPAPKGKK